ncbi:hypothetical protein [Amycolatopsis silviterrae]|uniref:PPOX class F420-dependent oxidoreductase n=1 Tax=Amycolatopsis silviterrae TaxID=1656914 RepID=A0ABW5HBS6_9PSEU
MPTVRPSGRLQTIWVHVENGSVVLNTETHRAKYRNVVRDDRITVLIRDEQDPYRYAEIRGRRRDRRTLPLQVDELARKHSGGDQLRTRPPPGDPGTADVHRPEAKRRRLMGPAAWCATT